MKRKFTSFPSRAPLRRQSGFTLIEMIVSIVIAGIAVASIGPIFRGNTRAFFMVANINENTQAARIGFNRMVAELRDIDRSSLISSATAGSITFRDVDGNTIAYAFGSGSITRSKTGIPNAILIPNVTGFTITYWNSANTQISPPLANPTNVFRLTVSLQITVAGRSSGFQASVNPRNIQFRPGV